MRRRWIAISALTAAAAAIAFAGWFPYYRLEREVAAARAQGLWTELSDIPKGIASASPKGANAAPIVRQAIIEGKFSGLLRTDFGEDVNLVLKGTASPAQRAEVRALLERNSYWLGAWRKAANCPRLDFERDWSEGYAVLFPEYADMKRGVQCLAAAAKLGMEPRENLLAAARLSVLLRQEPNIIANLVSVSMGKIALREAKHQHLAADVEGALGPPIDVRWTYAGELPCALDTIRNVGSPQWFKNMGTHDSRDILERIRNTGPWKANAAYRLVHDYRMLWGALPKDDDYQGAIRAIDRWVPRINAELAGASSIMGKLIAASSDASEFVKSFKKFEAERQAARQTPPNP